MNQRLKLCGSSANSPECGCLRTPGHFGPHVVLGSKPGSFLGKYPEMRTTKRVFAAIEFEIPAKVAAYAIADKEWSYAPEC